MKEAEDDADVADAVWKPRDGIIGKGPEDVVVFFAEEGNEKVGTDAEEEGGGVRDTDEEDSDALAEGFDEAQESQKKEARRHLAVEKVVQLRGNIVENQKDIRQCEWKTQKENDSKFSQMKGGRFAAKNRSINSLFRNLRISKGITASATKFRNRCFSKTY